MSTLDREGSGAGERRGDEHVPVVAHASSPAAAPIDGLGSSQALTPEAAIELLRHRPDQRDAVLARLHQTMGAAFVRQVVGLLEASPSSQPNVAATVSMSSLADSDDTETATTASATTSETRSPATSPSWTLPAVVRVTATDGLRVRRTPDATRGNNVLGGLAPHEEIEALAQEGEWLRVVYRGERAFIHGGFVELAPAPAAGADGHALSGQQLPSAAQAAAPTHGTPSGGTATVSPSTASGGSSTAPTHETAPIAPSPAPQAETAREPTADEFTTLSGNVIAKTTAKEAAVLNALRASPRRFDPAWLVVAQRNLGVVDVTGAMNTETLRAMRTRSGNQSLGVDGILNEAFLTGIAPGTPFFEAENGFSDAAADPRARTPADQAAQAVGYASFAAYKADWVAIRFLGKTLGPPNGGGSGRGHPYLAARVQAAEAFLRQRHPGLDDDGVIRAIGWNGKGNAAYADEIGTETSHQHTMGLAIDIDPAHNPYVFNETGTGLPHDQAMWWIETFEEMFRTATRIYGGEAITPATLMDWSKKSSSEELIQRVQATSSAFRQYLELSRRPEREILAALTGAGYSDAEARAELPNVQRAESLFHRGGGRQHASTITNIQADLLVALRDVAGLSWGGTEMSMRENGDFMHFDCRDTEFGRVVYSRRAPGRRR